MVDRVRQAYVPEVGRIEHRNMEIALLGPDDVLIVPVRIGICGSDVLAPSSPRRPQQP